MEQQLSLCRHAVLKVPIFTLSSPLGLWGSTLVFGNIVALNPGIGGVRNVASDIISHELTQTENKNAVFLKDLFSDYLT